LTFILNYLKTCIAQRSVQQHVSLRGIPKVIFDIPKNIYRPGKVDVGRWKSNSITPKLLLALWCLTTYINVVPHS